MKHLSPREHRAPLALGRWAEESHSLPEDSTRYFLPRGHHSESRDYATDILSEISATITNIRGIVE